MKTIILVALMLTGCASVSDYNQGCRDGVTGLYSEPAPKQTEKYCNGLEARRNLDKNQRKY